MFNGKKLKELEERIRLLEELVIQNSIAWRLLRGNIRDLHDYFNLREEYSPVPITTKLVVKK